MYESITLILLGLLLIPLGITNIKGNIHTIHWYNRRKITEETKKPYGKCIGAGTIFIAAGTVFTGVLTLFSSSVWVYAVLVVTYLIGFILILYAQFKYNKGIF